MKDIKLQATKTEERIVDEASLAKNVGSGSVAVFATPMMIALMEHTAATLLDEFLDEGETSVGVMMNTTHDAATPVGMKVYATAEITAVDRRKVSFRIEARDEKDVIGVATHDRVIVGKEKFEARAAAKLESK